MPAVRYQLSDIVQHRRRLEEAPFLRGAVQRPGQLIVEREGKQAHLLDVPAFPVAAVDEFAVQP